MKRRLLYSYILSSYVAAALLAGCGGSQPPIGAPESSARVWRANRVAHLSPTTSSYEVLLRFGVHHGTHPQAGLTNVNDTLYGTTLSGGGLGFGTVYRIDTTGREKVIHRFRLLSEGAYPIAALIDVCGTLYGTTSAGGGPANAGTVYSITP